MKEVSTQQSTGEYQSPLRLFFLLYLFILITLITFLVLAGKLIPLDSLLGVFATSLGFSIFFIPILYVFMYKPLNKEMKRGQQRKLSFDSAVESYISSMERIEEEKARTQALLSSIGDGVIATDKNGNVIFINNKAATLLGLSQDKIMGTNWKDIAADILDDKERTIPVERNPIYKTLIKGKVNVASFYFVRNNGTKTPVSACISPVTLNNQIDGAIMVFKDISKEKEIDRMKTEFISLAAHQLRTPLSAIRWFSEMLLNGDAGKLKEEQKEFVDNIYASCERMIQLVNALLSISRLESGRLVIEPKPTQLTTLIHEIIKDLKPKIAEKKLNLKVNLPDDLPLIVVDPKLIQQIYTNLLTNAVKYTDNGGTISVTLTRKDSNIVSQVKDNGMGIPEKDQKRVFEKFFRSDNVVKKETDGTGLGLYLLKKIIETSKGEIWFESQEGKGTSFWFSLPLHHKYSASKEAGMVTKTTN